MTLTTKFCEQCRAPVTASNLEEIHVFCSDACFESFKIECTTESKEELLESIAYAESRGEYLKDHLGERGEGGEF